MGLLDIFKIGQFKSEIEQLKTEKTAMQDKLSELGAADLDLCQYFGHKKLNIFSLHDINT